MVPEPTRDVLQHGGFAGLLRFALQRGVGHGMLLSGTGDLRVLGHVSARWQPARARGRPGHPAVRESPPTASRPHHGVRCNLQRDPGDEEGSRVPNCRNAEHGSSQPEVNTAWRLGYVQLCPDRPPRVTGLANDLRRHFHPYRGGRRPDKGLEARNGSA
ncbi:hypothetical protein GCM10010502_29060 [Kitasatospora aureofaciens]|uniref:Uncharacterized protein n=1 Tax=Kitasatospora aureofaciens TaxID=1894 RepID=A0A8H9HLW1_KITAU|nr:hypothetical protein GCM10010502_29060 [Kitasatospora aureofaciens]